MFVLGYKIRRLRINCEAKYGNVPKHVTLNRKVRGEKRTEDKYDKKMNTKDK
jgi:hypothetical protein